MTLQQYRIVTAGCIALLPIATRAGDPAGLPSGTWRVWLDSPGGPLPFQLEVSKECEAAVGPACKVEIINGGERLAFSQVALKGDSLTLAMLHYDSTIVAKVSEGGTRLDGAWSKPRSATDSTQMAFHAVAGQHWRFPLPESPVTFTDSGPIVGRWRVQFSGSDTHAIGVFTTPEPGIVHGTFLTTTGDYRYLAGQFDGKRLQLSSFDGAHAFLFDARMLPDGTLEGDFWSMDTWHETWTAKHDENVELDQPFGLTSVNAEVDLGSVFVTDLGGKRVSLNEAHFAGRPRIIELFGSWCPNCHDAAGYLAQLEERYRLRGLQIVGLAFELTGDFERDARQVRRYAERHHIEFPLLIAGTADKAKASAALPIIDRVRAYPTFLFVGSDNQVRAAYTGFSGPATGDAYQKLQRSFERALEGILPSAGIADE